MLIDNGAPITLAGDYTNDGTITVAPSGSVAITLKTLQDYESGVKDTLAERAITLEGTGSLVLSDSSSNTITASQSIDIFQVVRETISGAGDIGGGSPMTMQNAGVIDATGTNALVIDIDSGKLTNQAAGVLEGSGAGGLQIAGATFKDSGLLQALDGSSVTVGSAVDFTNDIAGTLKGGHYAVLDAGHGATLSVAGGPAVATLDAVVVLRDTGSVFESDGETLEDSLTTVASAGKLELDAGRGWSSPNALTVDGLIQLEGSAFAPAALTVASGGEVEGYGTISSPLADAGLVETLGGTLVLSGALSGTGTVEVKAHDTLELAQAAPAGLDVTFGGGIHATLKLDAASAFHATLDSWGHGDTLDLADLSATAASIAGNTLAITLSGGTVLDYTLANAPTDQRIVLSSDGSGGTDLTLYAAKTAAALVQSAAAWTTTAGAPALHPTAPAPSAAPLIAIAHG